MSTDKDATAIESVLHEERKFPPPADFAAESLLGDIETYEAMYRRSIEDPETENFLRETVLPAWRAEQLDRQLQALGQERAVRMAGPAENDT